MKLLRLALLGLALGLPVLSFAQWQWVDKDGRKVFSDRAPPADIAPKNILTQPGAKVIAPPSTGEAAAPVSPSPVKAAAPRLSGKDAQLESRKKQAEEEDNLKRKAEEEKKGVRVALLPWIPARDKEGDVKAYAAVEVY